MLGLAHMEWLRQQVLESDCRCQNPAVNSYISVPYAGNKNKKDLYFMGLLGGQIKLKQI